MKAGISGFLIGMGCIVVSVSILMIASLKQPESPQSVPQATPRATPQITATTPTLPGSPDGPTIIVFSSFTCPACAQSFSQLMYQHKTDTPTPTIAWKDMPDIRVQPEALPAAIAARCAYQQGKFWEYAQLLFDSQGDLTSNTYTTLATTLGLDATKFASCQSDPLTTQIILKDRQEGVQAGVTYTPFILKN